MQVQVPSNRVAGSDPYRDNAVPNLTELAGELGPEFAIEPLDSNARLASRLLLAMGMRDPGTEFPRS